MVLMTWIARVADGLLLAASMQEDEQAGRGLMDYQNQAKQLIRRMNGNSPVKGSLDAGEYFFYYFIERGVCYLALTERTFSKRLTFAYLDDLQTEFNTKYGFRIDKASRPYTFIEFDTYMQKAKKPYMDSRARRNLSPLNTELQDVQRIMVQNIDDVLQRGEALSALDDKASNLSMLSHKYKKDAHYLNLRSSYAKIGAIIVVIISFFLFLRYWIF